MTHLLDAQGTILLLLSLLTAPVGQNLGVQGSVLSFNLYDNLGQRVQLSLLAQMRKPRLREVKEPAPGVAQHKRGTGSARVLGRLSPKPVLSVTLRASRRAQNGSLPKPGGSQGSCGMWWVLWAQEEMWPCGKTFQEERSSRAKAWRRGSSV